MVNFLALYYLFITYLKQITSFGHCFKGFKNSSYYQPHFSILIFLFDGCPDCPERREPSGASIHSYLCNPKCLEKYYFSLFPHSGGWKYQNRFQDQASNSELNIENVKLSDSTNYFLFLWEDCCRKWFYSLTGWTYLLSALLLTHQWQCISA